LTPSDSFLYPKLKAKHKGRRFDNKEVTIENMTRKLKTTPKELPGMLPEVAELLKLSY
jgi:hypothetical protein